MTPRRFFAFSFAAVLAVCIAGCGYRAGSASSPSASPVPPPHFYGLLPMNLDIVAVDAKGVKFHSYWVYGPAPVLCATGDTSPYDTHVENATLEVSGHAPETYRDLYFVRCASAGVGQKGGSAAATLPLPLKVDIVGNDVTSGVVGKKFDRHLMLDKTAVACDPSETPVPEPGSGKPGQHVGNATVTLTFHGQTQSYHGDADFIRCSKEKSSAPMLRR